MSPAALVVAVPGCGDSVGGLSDMDLPQPLLRWVVFSRPLSGSPHCSPPELGMARAGLGYWGLGMESRGGTGSGPSLGLGRSGWWAWVGLGESGSGLWDRLRASQMGGCGGSGSWPWVGFGGSGLALWGGLGSIWQTVHGFKGNLIQGRGWVWGGVWPRAMTRFGAHQQQGWGRKQQNSLRPPPRFGVKHRPW